MLRVEHPFFLDCTSSLFGLDSLRGASVSACTAVYAEIGVDYILGIAFRDSLRRTLVNASTALDAVVINYVSHNTIFKNYSLLTMQR
jgi:hypothetical protein